MASAELERNTLIGLAVSVILAAGKIIAGVLGRSSALIADGVESLADTVGSVVVWMGLRVADREPDAAHPYGYGRAETVAALTVGGLLIAAAMLIVVNAVGDIMTPHDAPAAWTLIVLVVVVAVKEFLFRRVLRGAERFDSDAAKADAWHHRSDAITSAAAFIGVLIAVVGPGLFDAPRLVLADEAAAIVASGVILLTAARLIRPALLELLDASSPELASAVRATAAGVEGVRVIEKVHARKSGRGFLVDMHVHVAPEMEVRAGHALAGKVKATVLAAHPRVRHVLIHVEPDERPAVPPTAPGQGGCT
ncbi:MAG: cation transporter [Phycisphaeraceae bacterium]|nr:MAG: cation transporter [Phycisphaeraceae bacterium]